MICLAGRDILFYIVPKAFLPVGDSSFVRGVFVAQEGSSPEQMHAYQLQSEDALHANPAVDMTFTMTGNQRFLSLEPGICCWRFLKDPDKRPPILAVTGQLMGAINSTGAGTADIFAAEPGAGDQHRRDRESAGAIRLCALRHRSRPGVCVGRKIDGQDEAVSRDFCS